MSQVIGEPGAAGEVPDATRTPARSANPASPEEIVFEFVPTAAGEVEAAHVLASRAAPRWAGTTPAHRAGLLHRVADELMARTEELARLITREEGKTLTAATGEVGKTIEQFRFAAALAYQVEGTTYPQEVQGTFAYTLRVPLGVIVAITPWNFPVSLAARKIAPALAAGNVVLFKPSPVTAGAGRLLTETCHAAGIPHDVLPLVQGDDRDAMAALVGAEGVAAVTFTGSDAVGAVLRRTSNTRARLQFELGGHNAAVVCADANLTAAARKVASGAFELTGQACTSTDRVLVDRRVYEPFVDLLRERVEAMRVGPGLDPSVTVGPVATAAQHRRLTGLLASAASAGNIAGQARLEPSLDPIGYWIPPTVFVDVPPDHPLNTREIFGPLLSVVPVDDFDEAVTVVNASAHGLVTAVHTADVRKAHRFAQLVTCGIVKVNERTTGNGVAPPFGGWKASSSGAFPEGGRGALEFVTDTKSVYLGYEDA
jgi:alpha-ketoglutaric semialdehyde dehydrogenase